MSLVLSSSIKDNRERSTELLAAVLINGIQIQKVACDPVFCLHRVTVADGDGKR